MHDMPHHTTLTHHFPTLTPVQQKQLVQLMALYHSWNQRLNLVSRKDMDHLYTRHILHALSIAKLVKFPKRSRVIDVGTGGGIPGLPLAIYYPEVAFHLVDAIGKKIRAVAAIAAELQLTNVRTTHARAEKLAGHYDFILGRGVTALDKFIGWVKPRAQPEGGTQVLYLRGGAMPALPYPHQVHALAKVFDLPFFASKQLVQVQL